MLKKTITKPLALKHASSNLDFKEKFFNLLAISSVPEKSSVSLKATWIDTPLGAMIAVADEHGLYLLEFIEWAGLERSVKRLRDRCKSVLQLGNTAIIDQTKKELDAYFSGKLTSFTTPMIFFGTPFQMLVWQELRKIPVGETRSYADLARITGNSAAFRAVAQANATNQFAILVPCHRVINANGALGGYGGGLTRKQWLLDHEKILASNLIC